MSGDGYTHRPRVPASSVSFSEPPQLPHTPHPAKVAKNASLYIERSKSHVTYCEQDPLSGKVICSALNCQAKEFYTSIVRVVNTLYPFQHKSIPFSLPF